MGRRRIDFRRKRRGIVYIYLFMSARAPASGRWWRGARAGPGRSGPRCIPHLRAFERSIFRHRTGAGISRMCSGGCVRAFDSRCGVVAAAGAGSRLLASDSAENLRRGEGTAEGCVSAAQGGTEG